MKNLKYLLFIIPFLFLTNVRAETKEFDFYVSGEVGAFAAYNFTDIYSIADQSILDTMENNLVNYWKENLKSHHPYYYISIFYKDASTSGTSFDTITMSLTAFKAIPLNYTSFLTMSQSNEKVDLENRVQLTYYYKYFDNHYSDKPFGLYSGADYGIFYENTKNYYLPSSYYTSNFDLPFGLDDTYVVKKGDEVLFTLNKQDTIPTYKSKFINRTDLNYTEIDLNNYPYVALSLKDYSKTEEFNSMTYVKGQYCLTSVYNYGLTERKDILSGTQMQRCSLYYDEYIPIRTYILKSDLENHSIYYLKAYDTSKENKIKVDTSVFNIHYITEEEKNNPIITIDGKKYSTIPYDELTDTATKSEDENYTSGGSCAVGDINCTASLTSGSIKWSDIFTSPLDFLKNIWTSITQVFTLITYFIALLPTTLQYFFYISFTLAIVLGIIKIIL